MKMVLINFQIVYITSMPSRAVHVIYKQEHVCQKLKRMWWQKSYKESQQSITRHNVVWKEPKIEPEATVCWLQWRQQKRKKKPFFGTVSLVKLYVQLSDIERPCSNRNFCQHHAAAAFPWDLQLASPTFRALFDKFFSDNVNIRRSTAARGRLELKLNQFFITRFRPS